MISLEEYIKHEMSIARKTFNKIEYKWLKEAVRNIRNNTDIAEVRDKKVVKYMNHIAFQIPLSPITDSKNNWTPITNGGEHTNAYCHKRYPYMIKIERQDKESLIIDTARFRVIDINNGDINGSFVAGFTHPYFIHRDIGLIYRIATEIFPIKFPYKVEPFDKKGTIYAENVGKNEFAILYHREYLSDKMVRIMRAFRWNEKEQVHEEIPMTAYMKNKEESKDDTAGETGVN